MYDFLRELFGRDPLTQRMKAIFGVEDCRRQLHAILSKGIVDKKFDAERKELTKILDGFSERLTTALNQSDWWGDWDKLLREAKAKRKAGIPPSEG